MFSQIGWVEMRLDKVKTVAVFLKFAVADVYTPTTGPNIEHALTG